MSFWTGFLAGIVATYALSIGVIIGLVILQRRSERSAAARFYARSQQFDDQRSSACPEYPTVQFTHVTSIGSRVHGSD